MKPKYLKMLSFTEFRALKCCLSQDLGLGLEIRVRNELNLKKPAKPDENTRTCFLKHDRRAL